MKMQLEFLVWLQQLVVQETQVNECLLWLRSWVEAMDLDEEEDGEEEGESEVTTSMEVDEGSPVSLTQTWMTLDHWS